MRSANYGWTTLCQQIEVSKDLGKIENWRPITLSNTDVKLITKMYSDRLIGALNKNIDHEQTAYIPGSMINDNIRAILKAIECTSTNEQIDGLLISLDAKKAFLIQ